MYDGVVRGLLIWVVLVLWPLAGRAQVGAEFPADGVGESDPGFARLNNPAFPASAPVAPVVEVGPRLERADLQPYFGEGKLAEAKTAFDAGKYSRARELLSSVPESTPVRFLRALAALRSMDVAFASKEFEALADAWPQLRDRCLVHSGQSFELLRDWESAARVYARVAPSSRLMADARLGLARSLRYLKNPTAALDRIKEDAERPAPPWGRDLGAEALLVTADILAGKKDAKGERAALIKLWSRHPLSREAIRSEGRLGDVSDVGSEALVSRGEVLIDAHHNAEGEALIAPLLEALKLPDALACRAHFAVGKAQRKQRQHAKAVATLAPVVKKCRDRDVRARALFTLGFSQTFAAPLLAAQTYETLAHDYPESPLADDALFFAADGRLKRGERDEALDRLLELADSYPTSDNAADALFKLFWLARADGHPEEGLKFLEEIEGRFAGSEESYEVERARYWRGRVLEAAGQNDEAMVAYESVTREHPATYYGLIARERVEALDEQRGNTLRAEIAAARAGDDPFPVQAGPLANDPQFQSAVELLRLGLGELVPTEILAVDRTALPAESLRLLVLVLSLAGEERSAHGLARLWLRKDLSGPITTGRRPIWEIAYPLAFRDTVLDRAHASGDLDADLLQALMREESALDPKALSWAGALGLCQLMPATAAQVAAQLKLKHPSQNELLEPELNITLGSRYLSDLLIRARGIKQFALAGYNAGEGSVTRWRKENGDADLAEWVEQIPIQETRGYVKRVLRSYNTYKLLYTPGDVARTVVPPSKPPARPTKTG